MGPLLSFSKQVTKRRFEPGSLAPEPGLLNVALEAMFIFCFPNRSEARRKPRTPNFTSLCTFMVSKKQKVPNKHYR